MRLITVPQWGDIFSGNINSTNSSKPYRSKPEDMSRWLTMLNMSATAPAILGATESAAEFFKIEKDLALIVPRNEWAEFFFSLKNGFVSPNCPAQFIYFAKAIYKKYRICYLIGPMLPKEVSFYVTRNGYFGAGYTARDAICNFVNSHYQPITDERLIVRCGDWYEAYIPYTDMVAALPIEIGKLLSGDNLRNIRFTPGVGLTLEGRAITTLGGFQGVSNSFYDLRGVV